MNKHFTLTNNAAAANGVVAAFGLFTAAVAPALISGKPASRLNNLWISPIH